MKRIYSYSYLERKTGSPLGVTEWAMAKCRELGQITGVKWVSAFYGGTMRIRFSPVLYFRDIEAAGTKADQDWIMGVVLTLAEGRTGGVVGCVDLGDVLEAADRREPRFALGVVRALVSDDRLHLQVNRQGKPTMVFIPREAIKEPKPKQPAGQPAPKALPLPDLLADIVNLSKRIDEYTARAPAGYTVEALKQTSEKLTRTGLLISADLASKRLARPVWRFNDGGRGIAGYVGSTGDCATRAIAIATGMEYQQVYDLVNEFAAKERKSKRRTRKSSARTGVHHATMRRIMQALGWRWVATMGIGSGCTVHVKASELPAGRLVLSLSKHYAAMIDGVLEDTYDSSRDGSRCVYGYWIKESSDD